MGFRNIKYKLGLFDEILAETLREIDQVDYAFIDGNHHCEPTMSYFDQIWRMTSDGALFVFDDIRWSEGMKRAWGMIQRDQRVLLAVDFGLMGVCLTTKHVPAPPQEMQVVSLF